MKQRAYLLTVIVTATLVGGGVLWAVPKLSKMDKVAETPKIDLSNTKKDDSQYLFKDAIHGFTIVYPPQFSEIRTFHFSQDSSGSGEVSITRHDFIGDEGSFTFTISIFDRLSSENAKEAFKRLEYIENYTLQETLTVGGEFAYLYKKNSDRPKFEVALVNENSFYLISGKEKNEELFRSFIAKFAFEPSISFNIYFTDTKSEPSPRDCNEVSVTKRTVLKPLDKTTEEIILEQLLAGPTKKEKEENLISIGQKLTSILKSIKVKQGTAYVDWKDMPEIKNSTCGNILFLKPINATLTELPHINHVLHSVNGNPNAFYEQMKIPCPSIDQCKIENLTKDLGSFTSGYRKDQNAVYYDDWQIEGADSDTFQFIGDDIWGYYDIINFAKDKYAVYGNGKIWDGVDPESFKILGRSYYKDKSNLYYMGHKIEGADSKSFVVPEKGNVSDKYYIYIESDPVAKNELGIEVMGYYSKNNTKVFYKMVEIPGADPETFNYLGGLSGDIIISRGYAIDNNAVYFNGIKIEDADPKTFHELKPNRVGYYEDKNNQYAFGKKIQNDFELCSIDISLLPEGKNYWSKKLESINADKKGFEYCRSKEGGTLIAFLDEDMETKLFYWFDSNDNQVNQQPIKFACGEQQIPLAPQAIDTLAGNKVSLFCQADEDEVTSPCPYSITVIYELDLDTFKVTTSDDDYDCGYRG